MSEQEEVKKAAEISRCGAYRFTLSRIWDETKHPLVFVMLNPSTADADIDDPTIRRCMGFARRERAGGIHVVNIYPLRTKSPSVLLSGMHQISDAAWRRNSEVLAEAGKMDGPIICAWGSSFGSHLHDCIVRRALADIEKRPLRCLGTTAKGCPKHPLYLPGDAKLIVWEHSRTGGK